jgi:DNA polymerase-3 subunit beta
VLSDKFPEIKITKTETSIKIAPQTLKSALNKVAFAMLSDNSRPTLCGVLFEFVKDTLTLVATDAKRIAITKIKLIGEIDASFILPMKSVNILIKALNKSDITISVDKNKVLFYGPETLFISNLIDGDFPAYEKAIPKETIDKVNINKDAFISALKKAALFTSADSIAVQLKIDTDKMIVSKQTEFDDVQIKLPCKYTKEVTIGFNPIYLLDILTSISDAQIDIEIDGGEKPALLRKKNEYTYVMLPTRI